MSGTKIYYWDSCMYLAWLLGETSHGKQHIDAMTQIVKDNFELKNVLITSVITLTEVLAAKLTAEQEESFKRTFRSPNHILYDVDRAIASKARDFRSSVAKLSTPDAIHLATASVNEALEFHTFDDGQKDSKCIGLLQLNGDQRIDKIFVCKPTVPQTELGLALPPPSES